MIELKEQDITVVSTKPVCLTYTPTQNDANINGDVHGGVIFYLCDEAIGRTVKEMGRVGAAASGEIHYYRPARVGESLSATVSERKIGKRLGVFLVEARTATGVLAADALFTVSFAE